MSLAPGVRVGVYEVIAAIGAGEWVWVWLAALACRFAVPCSTFRFPGGRLEP